MILYTSGTGNSQWVATQLGKLLTEHVADVASLSPAISVSAAERLVFVMPIHSWGPALAMTRFIERATISASEAYVVFVCGDMCGNADKVFCKLLQRKGVKMLRAFSVQMPNNYILMKGFGIDTQEVAERKLQQAPERVAVIADAIINKVSNNATHPDPLYVRGPKPLIKTGLVYPLFKSLAIKKILFAADHRCNGCGKCTRVCPTQNIHLSDGRPAWGKDCVQCTACIHRCPRHAIEYGDISVGQGRYVHPICK